MTSSHGREVKPGQDEVERARGVVMPFGKFNRRSLGWVLDHEAWYFGHLRGIHIERRDVRIAVQVLLLAYPETIERAVTSWEAVRR